MVKYIDSSNDATEPFQLSPGLQPFDHEKRNLIILC